MDILEKVYYQYNKHKKVMFQTTNSGSVAFQKIFFQQGK